MFVLIRALVLLAFFAGPLIASCAWVDPVKEFPTRNEGDDELVYNDERPSVFGEGGLFGINADDDEPQSGAMVGVNEYLWRASLDTVSFMPLVSADPFGGTIITDWYADPAAPDERTKANIIIMGSKLSADGVRVSLFRQTRDGAEWNDAPVTPGTARKMEDAILTRARQLRIKQTGQ